ncbi:FAD-binding oxidoreductase [Ferruginibacter lapsinanis]|uniref:NAD(P)/FAD-dependent oxidoreductase n=1 Tax=Ferruginibacter lapsinanis TaxID=563172 RepID=UPI001E302DF2|nr:FAD-dependent oxidoreductase [Ferruginibacter lapsinanis]UEG49822.1 FAD-binding oxidoreductase [Ferruginibacter lapsinanis]
MPQLSVWEKESFFAPQDVIIVGSGFTGLWSALHLQQLHPHYKITILERGIIPTGASTRNAGFSCFGSPTELLHDEALMGEEKMLQLVEMRYKGLLEIKKYFTADEIDYDPCGGYECFTNKENIWDTCISNIDWLNSKLKNITNAENTFSVADSKISDFGFSGIAHLIENKFEGALHSGKLVQALQKKVQQAGVQILCGIEVISYQENSNSVEITTSAATFTAKQLLLCTNAFTNELIPAIDVIPNRGQVLLTSPIEDLKIKGTFHFDEGYYYFRNLGNRLLLGGARNKAFSEENTTAMQTTETIEKALNDFIQTYLLPKTSYTITDKWSGIMAMGSDKLPLVQAITDKVFCCVRMSGMGVALAPVASKEIAQIMNQ